MQEGEVDFVVVDPARGMLVLEVKGGEIEYNGNQQAWYRILPSGKRRDIKDPFYQARRGMYFLIEQILKRSFLGEKYLPCPYGYAVVFPDCVYSGPDPAGAHPSIVLDARHLKTFEKHIKGVLQKWRKGHHAQSLSESDLNGILKGLSPSFRLLPVLFRQVEDQEERLFRMTEDQVRLLEFLQDRPRAAIEGVAGSGKTLLARAQAERFADQGKSVLMVCFNKALAEWLTSSLADLYKDKITIRHFHGLGADLCKKAEIEFYPSKDHEQFWRYEAPELMLQALEKMETRFDAVVVDEGQDFYPEWWFPLELINKEADEGPLYVFYDPAQNLFNEDDPSGPDLGEPFRLPTNCRNTKRIAAVCSKVSGIEIPVRDDAPQGVGCKVGTTDDPKKQQSLCEKVVKDWLNRGQLKPSQIAILSRHQKPRSCLSDTQKVGKTPITTDLQRWKLNKGVLFATIRGFKGLEADAVVMLDIPNPEEHARFTKTDFYVGCSRAKHVLVILARSKLDL